MGARTFKKMELRRIAQLFKAMSDQTRLRIVNLLSAGEVCVCDIAAALDLPQPKVSRHLALLRNAGLVEDKRKGAWIFYSIAPLPDRTQRFIIDAVRASSHASEILKKDLSRLGLILGAGRCRWD